MNRFYFPAAAAVLVLGCARSAMFGLQPNRSVETDAPHVEVASETTVIVREVERKVPVVYVDTVYLEEEYLAPETVYVEEAYESYVYVQEPVLVPVPVHPHRGHRRWKPREPEPRPKGLIPEEAKPLPPGGQPDPNQPRIIVPQPPVKRTHAPAADVRRKPPARPIPPYRPLPPAREVPAQGDSLPAVPAQLEGPKQAPTPPVREPVEPTSAEGRIQVGMNQARRK